MLDANPDNKEAHEILIKTGWKFLGSDGESGYEHPSLPENTLIVSSSGAWRLIEPTSYREHIRVDGLLEDIEEELKTILEEKKLV